MSEYLVQRRSEEIAERAFHSALVAVLASQLTNYFVTGTALTLERFGWVIFLAVTVAGIVFGVVLVLSKLYYRQFPPRTSYY